MEKSKLEETLRQFPEELRCCLKEVTSESNLGLSWKSIRFIAGSRSCKNVDDELYLYSDKCTLEIPYAGAQLTWEVIFNLRNCEFAPDFFFHNDQFLSDPDIDVISTSVPSLANWNLKNKDCLISVIKEFLELYKQEQIYKLSSEIKYLQYYEDYKLIIGNPKFCENDIEVHIDNTESVHFLILIHVDTDSLPVSKQILTTGKASAKLRVSFHNNNKISSYLFLSPQLDDYFGSTSFQIPQLGKGEVALISYVTAIEKYLHAKILEIERQVQEKNKFISCLLAVQSNSIIEYDSIQFSYAALLIEVDSFYCLIYFTLGEHYPEERPRVQLRSVFHDYNGKPKTAMFDDYPYSPRWSTEEIVLRVLASLEAKVANFRIECQNKKK